MHLSAERVLYWSLLAVVVLSPLPLASVEPWAWAPLAVLVAAQLLFWAALVMRGDAVFEVPLRRVAASAILFALVVVWIVVQTSTSTPESWHHPIWSVSEGPLRTDLAGSIAIDRTAASAGIIRLTMYAAIFWLALQLCRRPENAKRAFIAIIAAGVVYALYGLVVRFSGSETVLWYEKVFYVGDVTSTFVNRNSYATLAGIGLVCLTAFIFRWMLEMLPQDVSTRERVRLFLSAVAERGWVYLLGWVILATALILTNSRAGFLSAVVGILAFFLALSFSPRVQSGIRWSIFIAAGVLALGLFALSGTTLSQRIGSTGAQDQFRVELYGLTLQAIGDEPVLGNGYGSFADVFNFYRGGSEAFGLKVNKAHNTYLENALELGIPAALALGVSVLLLAGICLIGVRRRARGIIYPAVGFAVSALVGVHAMFDFSLQNPAVTVTYLFVLGLGVAQSWSSRETL